MISKLLTKFGLISQPEVVFLIGLPCSGKSSYIKKKRDENKRFKKYAVCSTDGYIETFANIRGKKYHEMFEELYPEAEKNFFEHIDAAIENNTSLFIDRTNCSIQDRQQILAKIPSHYKKRAVIFHVPHDELRKRMQQRYETTGKLVPEDAFQRIVEKYEHPVSGEFDVLESGV